MKENDHSRGPSGPGSNLRNSGNRSSPTTPRDSTAPARPKSMYDPLELKKPIRELQKIKAISPPAEKPQRSEVEKLPETKEQTATAD